MLEPLGTPLESADGTSLDSACGTPSEERVMPWTTDSEELDREAYSPFLMREFCNEEALLEEAQYGEALEEMEVSFITGVFKYMNNQRIAFLFILLF